MMEQFPWWGPLQHLIQNTHQAPNINTERVRVTSTNLLNVNILMDNYYPLSCITMSWLAPILWFLCHKVTTFRRMAPLPKYIHLYIQTYMYIHSIGRQPLSLAIFQNLFIKDHHCLHHCVHFAFRNSCDQEIHVISQLSKACKIQSLCQVSKQTGQNVLQAMYSNVAVFYMCKYRNAWIDTVCG